MKLAGVAVALVALAALVWAISGWRNAVAQGDAHLERADSLARAVREAREELRAVEVRAEALLDAQRRQIDSLIAAVPRTPDSDAPERFRVLVDTVPLPPELTEVGRELLAYVGQLEEERDVLRRVVQSFPQRLDARDALWQTRLDAVKAALAARDEENAALREAIADYRNASGLSWTDKALWALVGAGAGALAVSVSN